MHFGGDKRWRQKKRKKMGEADWRGGLGTRGRGVHSTFTPSPFLPLTIFLLAASHYLDA